MFYGSKETILGFLMFIVLVLAGACGRWLGSRKSVKESPDALGHIGVVQGALLGLLGLLLGFTLSMAISRFDARKEKVIQEANTIGTAYLRAQILPEPLRPRAQQHFREYLATRVLSSQAALADPSQASLEAQARKLFDLLWGQAMSVVEQDIHPDAVALYVESLNEMNDTRARRNAALASHVPESVLILILAIAALSVAFVGYGFGNSLQKGGLTVNALCLALTLVIVLIIDLDRPRRGLVQVSQQALVELQSEIGIPARE
jgi:hypothetical protein